jgi:hypothetical protein
MLIETILPTHDFYGNVNSKYDINATLKWDGSIVATNSV